MLSSYTSKHDSIDDFDEKATKQSRTKKQNLKFLEVSSARISSKKKKKSLSVPLYATLMPIKWKYANEGSPIFSWTSPAIMTSPVTFGFRNHFSMELRRATLIGCTHQTQRVKEMKPSFHHSPEITLRRKVTQEPARNKLL